MHSLSIHNLAEVLTPYISSEEWSRGIDRVISYSFD
jgi:hypothetical protein